MRRWASSISGSIRSACRLIKRDEISARTVSNLNRSSTSVHKVSFDFCIFQALFPFAFACVQNYALSKMPFQQLMISLKEIIIFKAVV
jgi:hypothetical protein